MEDLPEDVVGRELASTEQLLWAGRPAQGVLLRAADAFLIPFSVVWCGFAIFWQVGVIASGAPFFVALWGVPFVLIGLYMLVGRFWGDARARAATVYGVTSERILIISGLWSRRVQSLNLDTLTDLTLTERQNGSGIITFGPKLPYAVWYQGAGWPWAGHWSVPAFELPAEARRVYEIIREAQRAIRGRA